MGVKDFEMSAEMQAYYGEKKKVFSFEIENGDHGGAFFYQMIFKQEVSRQEFLDIMEKARASDNRYADFYDQSFRDAHDILDVESLRPDYQDMLEEAYVYMRYNPETGQNEIVEEEDDW